MDLKVVLCMLLTNVCHAVTSVETSPPRVGATGAEKKASAMMAIPPFIADVQSRGANVVPDLVTAVGSSMIDHVVGLAHDLGAFTHKADQAAAGSDKA